MYDTVICSIDVSEPLREYRFQQGEIVMSLDGVGSKRMWWNPRDAYLPRVTYWRNIGEFRNGRLRLEFSIPQLVNCYPTDNVNQAEAERALDVADGFAREHFGQLPGVRAWSVQRIDYAWNWDIGADLPLYSSVLRGLTMGAMVWQTYPEHQGVMWKAARKNSRSVKFYDKGLQAGLKDVGVLRFEVSNFKRVLPYMCDKWFGCGRTVGEVVRPGRALYVMAAMWERLGLGSGQSYRKGDDALLVRLRMAFGRAAPAALYTLQCMQRYGRECHTTYKLMSSNTYYHWRRELVKHGFMTEYHDVSETSSLPSLCLPVREVCMMLKQAEKRPKNLASGEAATAMVAKKNSWENLARLLQIKPGLKVNKYLASEAERLGVIP